MTVLCECNSARLRLEYLFLWHFQVSHAEWEHIPECQEHLKIKDKKKASYSGVPDHIRAGAIGLQIGGGSGHATPIGSGGMGTNGTGTPLGLRTPMPGGMMSVKGMRPTTGGQTPMMHPGRNMLPGGTSTPLGGGGAMTPMQIKQYRQGNATPMGSSGMMTPMGGARSAMSGASGSASMTGTATMRDLSNAKQQSLMLKLDGFESRVSNTVRADTEGMLTELHTQQGSLLGADAQDIQKVLSIDEEILLENAPVATKIVLKKLLNLGFLCESHIILIPSCLFQTRLLMQSVVQSNPEKAEGWIAAARIEEMAGNISAAKEMVIQGTKHCPYNEDMWKEAARLEEKGKNVDAARSIIAKGIILFRSFVPVTTEVLRFCF